MSSADMGMDIDGGILHLVPQETKLYFAFWAWSLSLDSKWSILIIIVILIIWSIEYIVKSIIKLIHVLVQLLGRKNTS